MATMRLPHPLRDHPRMASTLRDAFWVIALGLIAAYAFFVALGAYSPGDVMGITIAVAVLAVLWAIRAYITAHAHRHDRDPTLAHVRERRGF